LPALIEVGAGFHPDLTGRENIYLNGTILGLKRAEIRRRFDQIVAFSGLGALIDTPVKRFSSGMYARLGFSVSAHVDPDILLVDEVLSVGDFLFQRRCLERMRAVLRGGATVVFVSHNLEAVSDREDRPVRRSRAGVPEQRPPATPSRPGQLVSISDVRTRGKDGPRNHFQAGERGYIDVEVTGHAICERLSVGIDLVMSAWIFRYDIDKEYDTWELVDTLFVSADRDARGIANLYPQATIGAVGTSEPAGTANLLGP
jgi:energy-coupling factor transporter ATP-binding protein EcfA2